MYHFQCWGWRNPDNLELTIRAGPSSSHAPSYEMISFARGVAYPKRGRCEINFTKKNASAAGGWHKKVSAS